MSNKTTSTDDTVSSTADMQEILGVPEDDNLEEITSIEALEKELEEMREQAEDYHDKYLRAQAELQNARQRMDREMTNARKFATEKLIKDLLPIIDSLEKGLESCQEDDSNPVKEGLTLTQKLFVDTLGRFSVTILNPQGELFEPEFHEAMGMQPSEDIPSGHVTLVIQKGYLLHDRVVRPARVMVAQ